jgi:membrane dipeptidase
VINIYVGPAVGNVIKQHGLKGHVANALLTDHIPRWRAGGLTAAIVQISDWPTLSMILSEIHQSEGRLALIKTRADYEALGPDTFGMGFSIEGYTTLAGDFDALCAMSEIGATAFTFSHNIQNVLCTGANERHGEGGFSHLGKATLEVLSTLPVMVDLVHTSRASFWDALELYSGEVFVSHSNSDAVCKHPRNLTDDQVKAVAERGGIIGLNSYRGYVAADPYSATISDYLDHALHSLLRPGRPEAHRDRCRLLGGPDGGPRGDPERRRPRRLARRRRFCRAHLRPGPGRPRGHQPHQQGPGRVDRAGPQP